MLEPSTARIRISEEVSLKHMVVELFKPPLTLKSRFFINIYLLRRWEFMLNTKQIPKNHNTFQMLNCISKGTLLYNKLSSLSGDNNMLLLF